MTTAGPTPQPVLPSPGNVTIYTTSWCGYCKSLTTQLTSLKVPFTKIDIEQDSNAAAYVEHVNGGNRTVPVVLFPDGTTLTNPPSGVVKSKLAAIPVPVSSQK
ncbi:MAG: mycoredoxin [Promicromonosporaceae bacterium]|nr:mycoredoxin [Promicromonosporaceae bacterium]